MPASELAQQGFDIQHAGRGGETTYHGPGQLVMYPVVNLRRLGIGARLYVETLEDCMVAACNHFGIAARVRSVHKFAIGFKQLTLCQFPIIEILLSLALPRIATAVSHSQGRVPSKTGVWVGDRKIGAVGVKISQGVASHGISLNVNTDLQHYNQIVPCGIEDCDITSVGRELQKSVDIDQVAKLLVQHFYDSLKYTGMQQMTPGELFAPGALALA